MSKTTPDARIDAAKPQLPVIIGSFVSGVAAMTLVGVLAPTIAAAGSSPATIIEQPAEPGFGGVPVGLTEITEAQRVEIAARLEAAEQALAQARTQADAAVARLGRAG